MSGVGGCQEFCGPGPFFCQLLLVFATSCGGDICQLKNDFSELLRLAVVAHLQAYSSVGTAPSTFHSPWDSWPLSLMHNTQPEPGVTFTSMGKLMGVALADESWSLGLGRAGSSARILGQEHCMFLTPQGPLPKEGT